MFSCPILNSSARKTRQADFAFCSFLNVIRFYQIIFPIPPVVPISTSSYLTPSLLCQVVKCVFMILGEDLNRLEHWQEVGLLSSPVSKL